MQGSQILSPLSRERLPFHPFIQGGAWKIISPELSRDRVDVWLPVANLLKLCPDQLYLTAIQNIVKKANLARRQPAAAGDSNAAGPDKSQCDWDTVNTQLFTDISQMVMKVAKCETAVACASWVVKELPMGAQKVAGLRLTVKLIEKWVKASADQPDERKKAEEALAKYIYIFRRLSTEQVLYQNRLGEQQYLCLANSPAQLIFKLYEHESIQKHVAGTSKLDVSNLPDIHKVADVITTINEVNVSKIRMVLVEKWLPSSLHSKQDEADMTMTFNINLMDLDTTVRTDEEVNEDEINLNRVIYVLQHGNLQSNVAFLFNFAFKMESQKITNMCRIRALRCLFKLADKKIIESLNCGSLDKIRQHMQMLLYMVELERLHIPQTLDEFERCNKEGLVHGIWRNHNHQQRAVKLVADLCLDYSIFDVQLWNSLLQQLRAFNMMEYLEHVLVCISGVSELWQVKCLQRMWQSVLMAPLVSATPPLSDVQLKAALQSANLLLRCPLLLQLDLLSLAKQYMRLELPVCAVACLRLIPQRAVQQQHVEQLLRLAGGPDTVLCQLADWTKTGKPVPMADKIQATIYQHLEEMGAYEEIAHTKHIVDFMEYLVQHDAISGLLLHALKHDRFDGASQLMKLYLKVHPDKSIVKDILSFECDDVKAIKFYLVAQGLEEEADKYLPKSLLDSSHEQPSTSSSLSFSE